MRLFEEIRGTVENGRKDRKRKKVHLELSFRELKIAWMLIN